jgi:hypothetical protein
MQTEGALNPIPILVHVLAIAAGLFVGWIVMDRITPNFPTADPGVESSSAPKAVAGGDPDSLYHPNNFSDAIGQLQEQFGAGQGAVSLHLEPGQIEVETSDVDGTFDLAEVPVAAPLRIGMAIEEQRPRLGLAEIAYMDLVATPNGPRWYVQIDVNATAEPPPWTYTAPLDANSVTPGGAPPEPVG